MSLRERLAEALLLKEVPRAGWLRAGVAEPESVAAHSWGVAWLVLVLCPDGIDRGRALAIAVLHDLAEARIGDITPHDGISHEEKQRREREAMTAMTASLGDELMSLWLEYEEASTPEGRFVKACDKLDMALQAHRYRARDAVDTRSFVDSALRAIDVETLAALAAGT